MNLTLHGRSSAFEAWVFTMSTAGLAVFAVAATSGAVRPADGPPGAFWLLVALVVATELFPVDLPKKGDTESITVSGTFGFALLLGWGVAASVLAFGIASAVSDLVQRKPLKKVLFNVAQYSLSLAAADLLYQFLGGGRPFSTGQVPAFVAAMVVFFVLNDLLVCITVALASGTSFASVIREDLVFKAWTSGMLLAMAPVALIVAERSAVLIPLLLLPLVATDRREGERLKDLIEQLLLASRFQDVPSEPAIHQLIDAAEVTRHAGRIGQLDHPGHHVVATVAGPLPVLAAPEAIAQVIGNLLDNAAKYSPDGAVIRLDAGREGATVVVAVTDSGQGVPR